MSYLRVISGLLLLAFALASAAALTVMMQWPWLAMHAMFLLVVLVWFISRYHRSGVYALGIFALSTVAFYFLLTPNGQFPPNTIWESSCARRPRVERAAGGKIRLFDIRDFKYRAEHDFDVRYRTGVYDPEQLRSLDLYVSHWDGMDEIAHTLLRFNFSDGTALVLSVEMRCPEGISRDYYTTFFKQHALIYIWGTPEDLCDLRSKYRGEALYRYRTAATPDEVKMLFAALIDRTAELAEKQEFYRVISGNCTTELLPYLKAMRPALRWDHRVLINGSIDRMLFEQGFLVHGDGEIFEELRARSLVSKSATQP